MDIGNDVSYSNQILKAIVVNSDWKQDPEDLGRIQVFIPYLQNNYINKFTEYMTDPNKTSNADRNIYPWAVTLVEDLKEGNEVYIGNIDNRNDQYIIFGKSVYSPANRNSIYSGNIDVNGLLNLTMPIILQEEVGIDVQDYPDHISINHYGNINCNDNGAMSLGLIQWNACRAHDCLFECAKNDSNWESYWEDKDDLYNSLRNSITSGDNTSYRSVCNSTLTRNSKRYNAIYSMLTSSKGQEAQLSLASSDTQDNIYTLVNTYSITNPAIIIFLADIMNQYGSGVNNVINGCVGKAGEISASSSKMEDQLNEYINWWKGSTSRYLARRDRVAAYIKQLISEGKLADYNPTTLGASGEQGQFIWPCDNHIVTSARKHRWGRMHNGIDIGISWAPVYASASGTAYTRDMPGGGYGNQIMINHHNGFCTLYAHLSSYTISNGQQVKQGQQIAVSGDTGSNGPGSYAPHLHFEIRKVDTDSIMEYYGISSENPLEYLSGDYSTTSGWDVES